MKLYDATVRLGGSRDHEVLKQGITAAEVVLLTVIHGEDAVVKVVDTALAETNAYRQDDLDAIREKRRTKRPRSRTDKEERERLQSIYGGALAKIEEIRTVNGVFGVGTTLPSTPPSLSDDYDDEDDDDNEDYAPGFAGSPSETVKRSATASASRDDINNDPFNPALLRVKDPTNVGPLPVDNVSAKMAAARQERDPAAPTNVVETEAKGETQSVEARKEADEQTGEPVKPEETSARPLTAAEKKAAKKAGTEQAPVDGAPQGNSQDEDI